MTDKIGEGFSFRHRNVAPESNSHAERDDGISDGAYWNVKGMQWLLYRVLPVLFVVGAVAYFVFGWRPR